jgi:hypothetical protein
LALVEAGALDGEFGGRFGRAERARGGHGGALDGGRVERGGGCVAGREGVERRKNDRFKLIEAVGELGEHVDLHLAADAEGGDDLPDDQVLRLGRAGVGLV